VVITGCVGTVAAEIQLALLWAKDKLEGIYERPLDDCFKPPNRYSTMGVLNKEGILHETTWSRLRRAGLTSGTSGCESNPLIPPSLRLVTVQARTRAGADIETVHRLEKNILL